MSSLSLPVKLRSWLDSNRLPIPLLAAVSVWGLGTPRPRRMRSLVVGPRLLGLASLGVLGWKAAQVCRPRVAASPLGRPRRPFAFTWQMTEVTEEITASAASGH